MSFRLVNILDMESPTKEIEDFESNSLKFLQPDQIEKIWLRLRGLWVTFSVFIILTVCKCVNDLSLHTCVIVFWVQIFHSVRAWLWMYCSLDYQSCQFGTFFGAPFQTHWKLRVNGWNAFKTSVKVPWRTCLQRNVLSIPLMQHQLILSFDGFNKIHYVWCSKCIFFCICVYYEFKSSSWPENV